MLLKKKIEKKKMLPGREVERPRGRPHQPQGRHGPQLLQDQLPAGGGDRLHHPLPGVRDIHRGGQTNGHHLAHCLPRYSTTTYK